MEYFPKKVIDAIEYLRKYLGKNAKIILFGSQVRKINICKDFDIGFYTTKKKISFKEYSILKGKIEDIAFPYRIDLKDLSYAPRWFKDSISNDSIVI